MQFRSAVIAFAIVFAPLSARAQDAAPPIIDGVALLGGPPADQSPRGAADRLQMHPHVSPERLAQATADIQIDPFVNFASAFDARFTAEHLPRTAALLQMARDGVGPVIGQTKNEWNRPRPFIADENVVQCLPLDEHLRANGSYPSGHSTIGWTWALVLAEVAPERASAILVRGRDYGDSRVICGVHFPSDVEAGRLIASGAVARLHGEPAFRRALEASRRELARAYPAN